MWQQCYILPPELGLDITDSCRVGADIVPTVQTNAAEVNVAAACAVLDDTIRDPGRSKGCVGGRSMSVWARGSRVERSSSVRNSHPRGRIRGRCELSKCFSKYECVLGDKSCVAAIKGRKRDSKYRVELIVAWYQWRGFFLVRILFWGCSVRSHFMRGMHSWRPRVIQDKFSHKNKCKARGMRSWRPRVIQDKFSHKNKCKARGMRSWRPRVIQDKFSHKKKCKARGMRSWRPRLIQDKFSHKNKLK
jgi:hypothetical protein